MTEKTVVVTVELTYIGTGEVYSKEEIAAIHKDALESMLDCDNVNVAKVQIFERDVVAITKETVAALEKIGEMTHSEE